MHAPPTSRPSPIYFSSVHTSTELPRSRCLSPLYRMRWLAADAPELEVNDLWRCTFSPSSCLRSFLLSLFVHPFCGCGSGLMKAIRLMMLADGEFCTSSKLVILPLCFPNCNFRWLYQSAPRELNKLDILYEVQCQIWSFSYLKPSQPVIV